MKTSQSIVLLLLALLLVAVPAAAQEEDEADEGTAGYYVEFGTWVAQPSGLEYRAASRVSPTEPFGTEILAPQIGTQSEGRYRVGYTLPSKLGTIVATVYHHEDPELTLSALSPGNFQYGQIWTPSPYSGFANDGLADGFDYTARSVLRDFRLDFKREAFRTARGSGSWFVGLRRVQHGREQMAVYYSILPDLPPLPSIAGPQPDLAPFPEGAQVVSRYKGRGLEFGFEFEAPLAGERFKLEGGVAFAALRGDLRTEYRAQTSYYQFTPPDGSPPFVLDPLDYEIAFGGTYLDSEGEPAAFVDSIDQISVLTGIQDTEGRELSSDVIETWIGTRVKLWRYFDLLVGFRQARYSNVGQDLVIPDSRATASATETNRSVTYEGFYGALSARF